MIPRYSILVAGENIGLDAHTIGEADKLAHEQAIANPDAEVTILLNFPERPRP